MPNGQVVNKDHSFTRKIARFWSKEKIDKILPGGNSILNPATAPLLLRYLGILNADATISRDSVRKLIQINHLARLLMPIFNDAIKRFKEVIIVDFGCGKGYLTFLMAHLFKEQFRHPAKIFGVDSEAKHIARVSRIADDSGLSETITFVQSTIKEFYLETSRVHIITALHACDTATDEALGYIVGHKADFFAVAPCCHAKLASILRESPLSQSHPLAALTESPLFRRQGGSILTDVLRMEFMRGCGYEITATEFVDEIHTPKNVLLMGSRRGQYLRERIESYARLTGLLNLSYLPLEESMPPVQKEILNALRSKSD